MPSSTASSLPTLYLIDGSAYIYRAFFALPPLNNSKGLQTNAVYGFTTTLMKIIREHQPHGLAVAFDEKGPTLRHEEYKAYKAQRPPMPEGMSVQIPYIHRVVEALNIPALRQAGYEADDLIGTLACQAERAGLEVVIVTGDKDMFQLLAPHIRIYDPVKNKWFGEAECRERYGVEPARVVEVMGLMGDSTDNIPGVKGIGEKTAIKLIAQFGTIDELLRRVEEVTPVRIKALLTEQADNARLSKKLATIDTHSPLEFHPELYQIKQPHQDQLTDLLRELEFTTLLKSFQPSPKPESKAQDTTIIEDEAAAQRFVTGLPEGSPLGVQCLLSGAPGMETDMLGLAVSTDGKTAFIPLDVRTFMRPITMLLHDTTRLKVVHDLKSTLLAFHRIGLTLAGPYMDTMIADYLLNPNRRDHQLETIALEMLGERLGPGNQAKAEAQSLFEVDPGSRSEAAEAAAALGRLGPVLTERLSQQGSMKLFTDVEMPLVPVLAEIERNGFLLDVDGLHALSKELERELDRITERIARLAGGEFNINSPKQLATVLFEKLGLKPVRKTKTGYSTDEDTLTQLATRIAVGDPELPESQQTQVDLCRRAAPIDQV